MQAYIQKHHLQVESWVNTPPVTGPRLAKRPKRLTTAPRNSGRISKEHTYVTIPKAPWRSPAAPMPTTARPVIKARDDGADAQTEPTGTDSVFNYRDRKASGASPGGTHTFEDHDEYQINVLWIKVLVDIRSGRGCRR